MYMYTDCNYVLTDDAYPVLSSKHTGPSKSFPVTKQVKKSHEIVATHLSPSKNKTPND